MENKGFNTYIRDLENTIIKVTDDALKQGIQPFILCLVLKSALYQLERATDNVVLLEKEEIKKQQEQEVQNEENKNN